MSKRFIRIKNENGISIKDTKTNYERYYAIEVLDDLNELADENKQLRKEHQEMLEKYLLLKLKIWEVLNDE